MTEFLSGGDAPSASPWGTRVSLSEEGQGVVEFLLLLPVMIGMLIIMVRVNSAITTSIVNQKYARIMALRLNWNSAVYPAGGAFQSGGFADPVKGTFFNRMIIGVANRPIGETDTKPEAHTQLVARSPALAGGQGPDHDEPVSRGFVRIRTTVEMCTQANYVNSSQGKMPIGEEVMNENMVLDFCAYEGNR